MARGRSIDKALPPTRALTQQRDYRARKAARIEQLEHDNSLLVAENDKLKDEISAMRSAEKRVEDAERDLKEAWRRLREEQEEMIRARKAVCGGPSRSLNISGDIEGRALDQASLRGYGTPKIDPSRQYFSPPTVTLSYPSTSDRTITPYQHLQSLSPQYQHIPKMKPCPQISASRLEEVAFKDDCCAGVLDCEALAKMPPQEPPTIRHTSIYPTSKETPFDPDCCSGLFDCNALSAFPSFPMETSRSDLDILVDVATHATIVDG